jgi:hypothetical protein
MGNNWSGPPPPPEPAPYSAPIPVISVPLKKSPVEDGASGLHYSGRVYNNQEQLLSSEICKGDAVSVDNAGEVMQGGISTTTLPTDESTKRISRTALQGYVQGLVDTGRIPGQMGDFDKQMAADKQFYALVQNEYCFYEARYKAALTQFLNVVADSHGADTNSVASALNLTVDINKRLNSLLEILNYVSNDRAEKVNARSPMINAANEKLQEKIATLKKQQEFLQSSDVRIRTQEEMMRYSAEKSSAMNTQIMFFVALNVVAIGTILTVYKSVRPSALA